MSALFIFTPMVASAAEPGELHISPTGTVSVKSAVVMQIAGTNLFTRVQWGDTFIRLTILLQKDTVISRKFGGKAVPADIREGDVLTVEGQLVDGTGNLQIKAKKLIDHLLVSENKEISGTITAVDRSKNIATVAAKSLGSIKVALSADLPIKKGARTIYANELVVGDKILTAAGMYDFPTKTLNVSSMEVYQDKKLFAQRTFEGSVQTVSGASAPAVLAVTIGNATYSVYVSATTTVMSKSRSPVSVSRIAIGDKVLILGKLRETNLLEIDATSVRDLAF